ncbi:MAG TPA: hypothetical protein VG722_06025, partial [Tepidisphaeraceae bacterium]|nr:hypothetical protein [Tepidisphaeraceae bacterium]
MTKVLEPANSTGGATSLSPRLASDTAASAAGSFAAVSIIVIQVLLIARLIGRYQLESPSFYRIILIALGGFLVHHLLPLRFRLSFFVLLCLVAPFLVMGFDQDGHIYEPGLITAAWLVGIGLGITTICLLRIGYWWKVGLLISVGAVLAALRKGWIPAQSLSLIWPILGSMFMFRVIVYIYDTHHDAKQPGILNTIAYFFLLPNICFPLFPVVDFKSFYRNYYKTDPILIYQKGFAWMTRGIIHLLLYRFVYYNFYITSGMVASGTDLIHFLITNVLLYLRVSGEFHIVIGIMQLFGFDLPETNRLYFLASSFTDYWRRVNIYWKDFILKVFYYPAAFRLKKWGPTRSLVAATLFCFLITWLLHSYQWFWIQGNFPITGQDSLFWGLLGLLVTVNAVREARHGRQRSLTPPRKTWRSRASLALRTAATFAIVTILWSLWSSDSLDNWLWIWTCADWWTAFYGLIALGVIAVGAILFDTRWMAQLRISPGVARSPSSFKIREAFITGFLPLCILYAPTTGLISSRMPGAAQQLFSSLQNPRPTEVDEDALVRGYYENLMDISRSNPQLEQLLKQRPADWQHLEDTDIVRFTGDFRYHELVPSKRVVINGQTITTNSWGMRDREYTLEKPAGTFRIALLDASTAMGLGVNDNETFENVLEQMLNAHRPVGQYRSYEVLDFGVNGFSIVCDLMTLENKAMA